MDIRITSLHYYPIKSCAGTAVQAVTLDALGVSFDRRWMVVEACDGQFLTQREHPKMAVISPTVSGEELTVRASAMPDLRIKLRAEGEQEPCPATVWKFSGTAEDEGEEAATWFSELLGVACRLVRTGAQWDRPVNPDYAAPTDRVGFADGYPVLLASQSSLANLNGRLPVPIPMDRFRPNIVVAGASLSPWDEDGWRQVRTGESGVTFRVAKPCARCMITTIDQTTAEMRGPEPLTTLNKFRRGDDGKLLFATNLIHDWRGSPLTLAVGDCVIPS